MQISKSLLSVFKISCSISVPYFLLLAENQTSASQNLLLGSSAQGQPQVGRLDFLQTGKLRVPAELPTLCWAHFQGMGQRSGGSKGQGRQGSSQKYHEGIVLEQQRGLAVQNEKKGKDIPFLSNVAQTSLTHKLHPGFLHTPVPPVLLF